MIRSQFAGWALVAALYPKLLKNLQDCLRNFDKFFPSMFFAAKPQKNKYRWFKVEGFCGGGLVVGKFQSVRCHKGFHALNSARQASPCKRPRARGEPIPPQSYSISK